VKVAAYCNIRNGTLSVKALEGAMKGRVIASVERLLMKDAKFKVSAAGRDRVRTTGVKNVHAFVVGDLVATWGCETRGDLDNDTRMSLSNGFFHSWQGGVPLTYDPRVNEGFVRKRGGTRVVSSAKAVVLDRCKVEAHRPVSAS